MWYVKYLERPTARRPKFLGPFEKRDDAVRQAGHLRDYLYKTQDRVTVEVVCREGFETRPFRTRAAGRY